MNIDIIDLGLIDYERAWKLQDEYAAEISEGKRPPTLLLLEHPHVYTFGRKGNAENLLWNETQLKEKEISTYWVDRGGDVTYHGPGQLVGYPLIPLTPLTPPPLPLGEGQGGERKADYVGYIRKLEDMLIGVLMQYGIASGQRTGKTGVWIQADVHSRCPRCSPEDRQKPAKIAAIGVKVDVHGVTRHGFALNVDPNMDYWNGIIPCGLTEPVVSLADLLDSVPSMQEVKKKVGEAFSSVFENQA
ncbi:MAG: lipoyl(octanoyl) transferase LipB [Anaerolineales bacterium]|nr:lipoyl(octanoyl) transferase LipB [Anaerolineales bacterium]